MIALYIELTTSDDKYFDYANSLVYKTHVKSIVVFSTNLFYLSRNTWVDNSLRTLSFLLSRLFGTKHVGVHESVKKVYHIYFPQLWKFANENYNNFP